MFKSVALLAIVAFVGVNAGFLGATIVEPAVAHVGSVVHSVPSAVSSQSFTRVHNKAQVSDIIAPVVRTVQAVPLAPIVKTVEVAPVVKSVQVAPVVQTYAAPISHIQYAAPVVSAYAAAPVFKTLVSPITYAIHH